jgi:hypothetical protein
MAAAYRPIRVCTQAGTQRLARTDVQLVQSPPGRNNFSLAANSGTRNRHPRKPPAVQRFAWRVLPQLGWHRGPNKPLLETTVQERAIENAAAVLMGAHLVQALRVQPEKPAMDGTIDR